jgi:Iron only hydrogenase large subunit, C-terminal domain
MSASLPTVDRRPVPTVAIIGNDAVLAAAPATPVQLSHACIRRGFSVAVPASWGDELVAAEAVRRLASREKGPSVMCVCPFVRSRLLAPGPDLAPFLVSLVSPPVATARYLRAAYGEHGVHITYIGGCPSADDPAIDARLTPDAFLADIADQGIALSEQPLVFDSIVPPDRRRWCSLPGGVPTAEVLWSDADARTLIEIERDDVSTDLAQHIITHEHVLLDLAPSLGCVCSGAISSVPAHSARGAVTALEPPRALGPVIDPGAVVSLDVPVAESRTSSSDVVRSVAGVAEAELMERRLDEVLGAQMIQPVIEHEFEAELDAEVAAEITAPRPTEEPYDASAVPQTSAPTSVVRLRTPVPLPARHPASSIPKATGSDGRALPRAYVAKRRTPSGSVPVIPALLPTSQEPPPKPETSIEPIATVETPRDSAETPPTVATNARDAGTTTSTDPAAPNSGPAIENTARPEGNHGRGAVAAPVPNPGGLVVLLVALLALGFFVLRSLR